MTKAFVLAHFNTIFGPQVDEPKWSKDAWQSREFKYVSKNREISSLSLIRRFDGKTAPSYELWFLANHRNLWFLLIINTFNYFSKGFPFIVTVVVVSFFQRGLLSRDL